MPPRHVTLRNSLRPMPADAGIAPASADGPSLTVSIFLRPENAPKRRIGSRADLAELANRYDREKLSADRVVAHADMAAAIREFADANGLTVTSTDLIGRRIQLQGAPSSLEAAFGTRLHTHEHRGLRHRYPRRPIRIPSQMRSRIMAVLGLDERPQVRRGLRRAAVQGAGSGLLPSAVAALYGLRTGGVGAGQCIGLIQPAGGHSSDDLEAACRAMNVPTPTVVDVAVGSGRNAFGQDLEADKEVALDLQAAIGVAPGARFAVYFTTNDDAGLVNAVTTAIHDTANHPSVLATSWGDAEANWSDDARRAMDAALADAARLGITVVAATGDMLATDGLMDARVHVDYPASSPYVLACGGTRVALTADGASIQSEQVWNDRTSGTGGGISDAYQVPAYQRRVALPASLNDGARRRGVPDLAAAAASEPGYRIVCRGSEFAMGGTSAVTPLWAGLLALINERRQVPLGLVHSHLYGSPGVFRPVTVGDNKPFGSDLGYEAGPAWSACTGLGAPIGAALLEALMGEALSRA